MTYQRMTISILCLFVGLDLAAANQCRHIFTNNSHLYSKFEREIFELLSQDQSPPLLLPEKIELSWGSIPVKIQLIKPQKTGAVLNQIASLLKSKKEWKNVDFGVVTEGTPNAYAGYIRDLNLVVIRSMDVLKAALIHELKHVTQQAETERGLTTIFSGIAPDYFSTNPLFASNVGWNLQEYTAHPENIYLATSPEQRHTFTTAYKDNVLGEPLSPLLTTIQNLKKPTKDPFKVSIASENSITLTHGSDSNWSEQSILTVNVDQGFVRVFIKAPGLTTQGLPLHIELFFSASNSQRIVEKLFKAFQADKKGFLKKKPWAEFIDRIDDRLQRTVMLQEALLVRSEKIIEEINHGKTGEEDAQELLLFVQKLDTVYEKPLD